MAGNARTQRPSCMRSRRRTTQNARASISAEKAVGKGDKHSQMHVAMLKFFLSHRQGPNVPHLQRRRNDQGDGNANQIVRGTDENKGKRHNLGTPHIHAWAGLVAVLNVHRKWAKRTARCCPNIWDGNVHFGYNKRNKYAAAGIKSATFRH